MDPKTLNRRGIQVDHAVTVRQSPEKVFRIWRNFENLPRFMRHLRSVEMVDEQRSHWVAKGPAGSSIEWDAAILSEREGELISWASLKDAAVDHAGSVRFRPAAGGRETQIEVTLRYKPTAGRLGAAVAKLLGEEPSLQIAEDLRRFKHLVERGDFPASQPLDFTAAPETRGKDSGAPADVF